MAKSKQPQVPLVSVDRSTSQPPLPGGWVLALFSALDRFLGSDVPLPIKRRTKTRIQRGEEIKQLSHDQLVARLASVVMEYFPSVGRMNDFAVKYCDEYFRCWTVAAQIAPIWSQAFGYEPGCSAILARALIRDLALRFAYLESCERALASDPSLIKQSTIFSHEGSKALYTSMIEKAQEAHACSEVMMAERLGTTDRQLRRIREGKADPSWSLLQELSDAGHDIRLVAGIGFIDTLLHRLGLSESALGAELFAMAEVFFPAHAYALAEVAKQGGSLAEIFSYGNNLLLHPGFDLMWHQMPSALWRAHLYNLSYARMPDLAQAYAQFGREDNDRELSRFFETAEKNSDDCLYGWMDALQRPNPMIPFPNSKDTV